MKALEWLVFAIGGTLAACIAPPLLFYTGIAIPFGLVPNTAPLHLYLYTLLHRPSMALIVSAIIVLVGIHGAHRTGIIFCDLGIPKGMVVEKILYGVIIACGITAYTILAR